MNTLTDTLWIEWRKAVRSRVPLLVLVGFLFIPVGLAFLMFLYRYPELAHSAGLVGAKANLAGGSADWPSYLSMLAQAVAAGGYILGTILGSWVFGREFSDGTMKDLLALPVARSTILLAKFLVIAFWCVILAVLGSLMSLVIGVLLDLPLGSTDVFLQSLSTLSVTILLVMAIITPAAFFASLGRGYLLPVGIAVMSLLFANVMSVAGWGNYIPWAIPMLYAQAGSQHTDLGSISYGIVLLTGLVGVIGTYLWWKLADQNR